VAIGWFNGQPCLYFATDELDADVPACFKAIIVNCSIVWTPHGGALRSTISMMSGTIAGATLATVSTRRLASWSDGGDLLKLS